MRSKEFIAPQSSTEIDFTGLPKGRRRLGLPLLEIIGWVIVSLVLIPVVAYFINTEVAAAILAFEALGLYLLLPALGLALLFLPSFSMNRRLRTFTKQSKQEHALTEVFAKHNNLLQGSKVKLDPKKEPGSLFRFGTMQECGNAISGEFMGLKYTLYQHEYFFGASEGYSWRFENTVMAFTLPRALPQFIIDSRLYSQGNTQSGLPLLFGRSQEVKLEGTFSKYFRLYAPAKYHVPALSILTPDVMLAILETGMECDIEIVGNKLYFYWPYMEPTVENYQAYYHVAEVFLKEVKRKLLSADIYANEAQALEHGSLSPSKGARLKPGIIARLSAIPSEVFRWATLVFAVIILLGFAIETPSAATNTLLERIATFALWAYIAGLGVFSVLAYIVALRNAMIQRRGIALAQELRKNSFNL